jgi:hypothetical protein
MSQADFADIFKRKRPPTEAASSRSRDQSPIAVSGNVYFVQAKADELASAFAGQVPVFAASAYEARHFAGSSG